MGNNMSEKHLVDNIYWLFFQGMLQEISMMKNEACKNGESNRKKSSEFLKQINKCFKIGEIYTNL